MGGLGAVAALMGVAGVVFAALAVFLSGPPLLVRGARSFGVAGLLLGLAGMAQELWANGFQLDLSQRGGQGSVFASVGMLLMIFGAARVAERRRADLNRKRWIEEHPTRPRPSGD